MLTASIVVHKTPAVQVGKAVDCLLSASVDKIYIIDNSPDDSLKKCLKENPKILYLHTENHGYGAAHNIAIKESIDSGASFHIVMNPDVYWNEDVIPRLLQYMIDNPEIGLIAPKILYPDGELQFSCRMLPSPYDLFLKRFIPSSLAKKRIDRYLLKDFDHESPINCPYLLGAFMFFNTKALQECGLFDKRFFMYPEDLDLTRRINEKWETIYWPKVLIYHEHQQASKKNLKMFMIHFVNMVRYFNKWGWFYDLKRDKINDKLSLQLGRKYSSQNNSK